MTSPARQHAEEIAAIVWRATGPIDGPPAEALERFTRAITAIAEDGAAPPALAEIALLWLGLRAGGMAEGLAASVVISLLRADLAAPLVAEPPPTMLEVVSRVVSSLSASLRSSRQPHCRGVDLILIHHAARLLVSRADTSEDLRVIAARALTGQEAALARLLADTARQDRERQRNL